MSDIKVLIHPVVIIHITDHITRFNYKSGSTPKIYGVLLGTVNGKTVEVFYGFEINSKEGTVDKDLVRRRYDQYFQNFNFLTIIGIYSTNKEADKTELALAKQVGEVAKRDLEVCITCDPQNISKERPFGIYHIKKGTFLPVPINVATTDQERICMDLILDPSVGGEASAADRYTDQITNLIDDLTQLKEKVNVLLKYLKGYKDIPLENRNYDIIRKISTAVHLLPQVEANLASKQGTSSTASLPPATTTTSSSSSSFSLPFFSRLSESGITVALATLSQNLSLSLETASLFEVVDRSYRHSFDHDEERHGHGMPPFGGMGGLGGLGGFGGLFSRMYRRK